MSKWWFAWIGRPPAGRERWQGYAWALASTFVCSVCAGLLRDRAREANVVMVYLLGVLPVALRGEPGPAVAAAILGVLAYDFFFVRPFFTFAVSDTQYVFTFTVMGLVGATISTLTARLSAEIADARQGERRARALYELSRCLLSARAPADVLAEGARVIGQELGQPVAAWLADPAGRPKPAGLPLPTTTAEQELVRWVLHEGRAAGRGTDDLPGARWLLVPVGAGPRVNGAIGIRLEEDAAAPGPETRAVLETGANLLAIALEQARTREEASAANARAQTERVRSDMLASVSHDLRTPLTGIIGAASSLAGGADALPLELRRELARDIVAEAERLSRVVTNLLHATRLEAGQLAPHREWVGLEDVLAPALARLEARLADHPLTLDLPPDLPVISGDPVLLELVFTNLLENAAKYTPAGTPVTVRARQQAGRLVVEVADRGPGLPEGQEEQVFERFTRYARGSSAPGTGLGLSICRGVVEAHGGTIRAYNQAGGGTVFHVDLPAVAEEGWAHG